MNTEMERRAVRTLEGIKSDMDSRVDIRASMVRMEDMGMDMGMGRVLWVVS